MTDWNAYIPVLEEYLRRLQVGATLALFLPGDREILIGRFDGRMVATLTDKHCRDERLKLSEADQRVLEELNWFGPPPSWGLSIANPGDAHIVDLAKRCVITMIDAFHVDSPAQVTPRCRIGGGGPEGRDLDVSSLRFAPPVAEPIFGRRPSSGGRSVFDQHPPSVYPPPPAQNQPPAQPQPVRSPQAQPQPVPAQPQQAYAPPGYAQPAYQPPAYPPPAYPQGGYPSPVHHAPPPYQQPSPYPAPPVQRQPAFQPQAAPVPPGRAAVFDTSGWRAGKTEDAWVDGAGANIALKIQDFPLTETHWLDDLETARRNLAASYSQHGCLIQADPVWIGGVPGMAQVFKIPHPSRRSGLLFGASVFLAKSTRTVVLQFMDEEGPVSGVREATAMARFGSFAPAQHPYVRDLTGRLPFNRADDASLDPQFPDHPLSRARAWVRDLDRRVRLDAAFAALPDFRGTSR
ncbi:TY-Chap domain-containing protein [Actinocorallia longicatena]|uniref:TY-Chap N-terminal domain-containing protein n=1 Tax=Actinocorallia longicatena TaxID=111803 RepID=A0ABP6QEQ9_9ACTN